MGLRVWRRIRFGCFSLNVSKRHLSLSVGQRGAHLTFGRQGVRATVGIPGTGIYYTKLRRIKRNG